MYSDRLIRYPIPFRFIHHNLRDTNIYLYPLSIHKMRNYKQTLVNYHQAKYGVTPQVKTKAELSSNFMVDSMVDYITDLQKQKVRCTTQQELAVLN